MVLVLFGFTVVTENNVDAVIPTPALKVHVTAFQWGWRFQYPGNVTVTGVTTEDPDPVGLNGGSAPRPSTAWARAWSCPRARPPGSRSTPRTSSTASTCPSSISAATPSPGSPTSSTSPCQHAGIYRAQCTQLCGLYHSLMFFHVVALPPAQFRAWLQLAAKHRPARRDRLSSSNSTTKAAA